MSAAVLQLARRRRGPGGRSGALRGERGGPGSEESGPAAERGGRGRVNGKGGGAAGRGASRADYQREARHRRSSTEAIADRFRARRQAEA